MHGATSITDRYPPRVGAHRWLPLKDGALPYSSGLLEGAFPHAPAPQKHPDQHTAPEQTVSSIRSSPHPRSTQLRSLFLTPLFPISPFSLFPK